MNITSCSVKVMRSYDYCHFGVLLSADMPPPGFGATQVGSETQAIDALRIQAARLADRAVSDYKRKKEALALKDDWTFRDLKEVVAKVKEKPESEWTPEDKAAVKKHGDILHESKFDYDYPDQEDDDE